MGSDGRTGRPWRRARAQVLAASTVCVLCGHEGAGDVDHDPPLTVIRALGLDPCDPALLRPAHGSLSRCPTCGRCCNQIKGSRAAMPPPLNTSRRW
ncbi:hypothetical protein [Actinoallomurus sp. CA-142502]|uniref:hypothetical protein n=1 Tax=Actinoallomurus sp. CA-142502 TaxID=3239885 RepID=UPI003D8F3780